MLIRTPVVLVSLVCLALGTTDVQAALSDDDLKQQQVAYAKQLYEQGVAELAGTNYDEALRLFGEAYRYAPQLHLFNYNIGQAADLAGNCQRARTAFQMFLDLVPEHPERETVTTRLEEIQRECPYDVETNEAMTVESLERHETNRSEELAQRALQKALEELRKSIQLYERIVAAHPDASGIKRILSKKQRHEQQMLKLFESQNIAVPERRENGQQTPSSLAQGCVKAAAQEKRNASAFGEVIDHFDSREVWRVMNRLLRHAERRDRPRVENCS